MVYRYIPILRFKAGERDALKNLSLVGRLGVTPLLLLAPDQFVGKKATAKNPAVASPVQFVSQMAASWGQEPFFLDATALPTTPAGHPLAAIAAVARAHNLKLIPSTTLTAPAPYQAAVNGAVAADGRGVALKIDLSDLASSAAWVPGWAFPLNQTDLIVDLGATISVANAMGAALDPAFLTLAGAGQWRSVTVAGASMPENFTGLAAGLIPMPRVEVLLWNRLRALTPYQLDFGDYGTVSTAPAPGGIKWGYPINVKYTVGNDFLICRGVRTVGLGSVDMDVQLRAHAASIVAYPTRAPIAYCWGDGRIDQIAAGAISPNNLGGWVGFSVNRHIETTRANLP
jgi:hypothetical protein